ncbi:nondiscriminating glutamyl-tRNA synthetase EARS2, mitochondrial [Panulirus ornatus]|uniref:nondiscriminating glutamyl-tRNA synthetase EARS2, mitochondrial n=1 Tax=Panulirus ornatus TaxID=150431 RepID=UPI003A890283
MARLLMKLHSKILPSCHIRVYSQLREWCTSPSQAAGEVRVRFAPSPTGHLHLGGLRTALYNFLFARSKNGKFILRIEDTDQTRVVPQATQMLETMLLWAKISPDESPTVGGPLGPYLQSQRLHIYHKYIGKLLENGSAYRCFCTNMRLNWLRNDATRRNETPKYDNKCRSLSFTKIQELQRQGVPYCIRLKLEKITEPFQDLIYGPFLYDVADHEGDPVIIKSDGYPTYHFANVIDDHLMGITHVLRGVEWQMSTPKHLLLYKAFGWTAPLFGHLPLILNKDGSKLSKRQGDLHIEYYQAQGYFPEAVLNFVTDIGGGFENREHSELLSVEELARKFDVSRLNKNSCRLDKCKLEQYNRLALTKCIKSPTELPLLITQLQNLVQNAFGKRLLSSAVQARVFSTDYLKTVLIMNEGRITHLQDLLKPEFTYVWIVPDHLPLDQLPAITHSHAEVLETVLEVLIATSDNFTKEHIVEAIKCVGKQYGLKIHVIMKLIRMTVSGLKEGPPVGEMLFMLGKDTTVERIKHALYILQN